MVGVTSNRSDRGQLVLVGAITIAFILLGVVVVFNGVQYTETINTGSASESVEDIRMTEAELEVAIEDYIRHEDPSDGDELEEFVENFVGDYQQTRAEQRPVQVHVIEPDALSENEINVTYSYTAQGVTTVGNVTVGDEP